MWRSRKVVICFLTLVLFTTSLVFSEGCVWCFCPDGHIHAALFSDGFNCGKFSAPTSKSTPSNYFINDVTSFAVDCCECDGIHFTKDSFLQKRNQITSLLSKTVTPVLATLQCLPSIIIAKDLFFRPLKILFPILSLIHSTILLI